MNRGEFYPAAFTVTTRASGAETLEDDPDASKPIQPKDGRREEPVNDAKIVKIAASS